jgi:Ca2+-binding RTX toxin-like protein
MSVARKGRKVTVRVGGARVPLPRGYTNRKCDEIRVVGLAGDDQLTVDSSKGRLPDVDLIGGKGDDVLTGGTRSDVLDGGQGDDVLRPGDGGSDVLDGGVGADTYLVDADLPGQARIVEPDADGPDHLSFAATSRAVTVELGSKASQPVSSAYAVVLPHLGIEELTGGDGADHLLGGNAPDRIHGGPGDDVLSRPFGVNGGDGNVWFGDAGDDTFEVFVSCAGCHLGSTRLEDSSGTDTVSFALSGGPSKLDLRLTTWQAVTPAYDLQLAPASVFENAVASSSAELIGNDAGNRLTGGIGLDTLTGGTGADTFVPAPPSPFLYGGAADTITDFAAAVDTVDLEGLTVKAGLGTSTVTLWDGVADRGSVTASNGHLWTGADFT